MRHIRLKLKDEVVRGMTRKQYYAASHYARSVARMAERSIDWSKLSKHFQDSLLYGQVVIKFKDMIL